MSNVKRLTKKTLASQQQQQSEDRSTVVFKSSIQKMFILQFFCHCFFFIFPKMMSEKQGLHTRRRLSQQQ